MTKIYTKFGDDGKTHLYGGVVVAKTHILIEFYGVLDELNCFLGLAKEAIRVENKFAEFFSQIERIQQELLLFPSIIAQKKSPDISIYILKLEHEIDLISTKLPELNSFILPGGSEIAARLHVTRSFCRRAERVLLHYSKDNSFDWNGQEVAKYLNRLSDWLYVSARLFSL